jgi:hypothetical protein
MGDLNARTGQESDFIEYEENDSNIPLFDDYTPDFTSMTSFHPIYSALVYYTTSPVIMTCKISLSDLLCIYRLKFFDLSVYIYR